MKTTRHEVTSLPLNSLVLDMRLQHRQINEQYIAEILDAVADEPNFKMPPVSVMLDEAGMHWLFDGFHRYHVYKMRGRTTIPAQVYSGSFHMAKEASMGVNETNGMRRTKSERERILHIAFADSVICGKSDADIADIVSMGRTTVYRFRQMLDEAKAADQAQSGDGEGTDKPQETQEASQNCHPASPEGEGCKSIGDRATPLAVLASNPTPKDDAAPKQDDKPQDAPQLVPEQSKYLVKMDKARRILSQLVRALDDLDLYTSLVTHMTAIRQSIGG